MNRIKRYSAEVLENHSSEFGTSFADNKKALEKLSIVRSKELRNELAGFITRSFRKEERFAKRRLEQEEADRKLAEEAARIDAGDLAAQTGVELEPTVHEAVVSDAPGGSEKSSDRTGDGEDPRAIPA